MEMSCEGLAQSPPSQVMTPNKPNKGATVVIGLQWTPVRMFMVSDLSRAFTGSCDNVMCDIKLPIDGVYLANGNFLLSIT